MSYCKNATPGSSSHAHVTQALQNEGSKYHFLIKVSNVESLPAANSSSTIDNDWKN